MKKHFLIFAIAAAFSVPACNEKAAETETAGHHNETMDDADMPAGMKEQHGEMMDGAESKRMQHIPDYAAAPPAVKDQLNQVLQQYLKLKDALVASDMGAAGSAASALAETAKKVKPELLEGDQQRFAQEKITRISGSASKISGAASLNEQRENLQPLSEAVYALTSAFQASSETLYYQHCPMANNNTGGYWMSSTKEIRNPYFGDKMLTCGSTQETLNQ